MGAARIVIVDDSEEMLDFCSLTLKDRYEVFPCNNPRKIFEVIKANKPDLILLDIYLPGADGLTICEKIKNDKQFSHIPVILMTGLTREEFLPPGFWQIGTPADGFLNKPFELGDLLKEVGRVLGKKKRRIDEQPKGGYL